MTTTQLFIEDEYPALVPVASTDELSPFLGHRLAIEYRGNKATAVLLPGGFPASGSPVTLKAEQFSKSYRVLPPESIRLAGAVANYYLAPVESVLSLMLPPAPKRTPGPVKGVENPPLPQAGEINAQQQAVVDGILASDQAVYREHLIWGVTGSGKTRIYEHLIAAALKEGKQTLLLVPEIALSGQLMRVIRERFPGQTVLYHSGLADGERLDVYRRFLAGTAGVAIGTRSAVFLPALSLAQIIIDEEHDASFKDQRKIRYDTRAVARLRADAPRLILGSATPSMESLSRAKTGQAKLFRLKNRATGQALPQVFVPEYKPQHGLISPFLRDKMREHLAAGNQVLLLMNRRGHSTHVHCPACDGYAECPRCSVALSYHTDNVLRCHYCGHRERYQEACPRDGSARRLSGRGIQRVEEILEHQFPGLDYARLDRDTARRKGFTEEVLNALHAGKIRILIGTQMIAKGFDIANVTLVGVLAIDQTLTAPDFRSGESAWQLLSQVIGRSGRHKPGEVVIQTMAPQHPAVQAAANHDADAFYAAEAGYRRLTHYPPFGALARIIIQGEVESALHQLADRIQTAIAPENSRDIFAAEKSESLVLMGPATPSLARLENTYRVHFIIKAANEKELSNYLSRAWPQVERMAAQAKLAAILDIDPRETN